MKQREHQQKTKKEKRKEREGSPPSPLAKKKNVRALRLQRVPDSRAADGMHVRLREDARAGDPEREDGVRLVEDV
jgi:hypothetical protein